MAEQTADNKTNLYNFAKAIVGNYVVSICPKKGRLFENAKGLYGVFERNGISSTMEHILEALMFARPRKPAILAIDLGKGAATRLCEYLEEFGIDTIMENKKVSRDDLYKKEYRNFLFDWEKAYIRCGERYGNDLTLETEDIFRTLFVLSYDSSKFTGDEIWTDNPDESLKRLYKRIFIDKLTTYGLIGIVSVIGLIFVIEILSVFFL